MLRTDAITSADREAIKISANERAWIEFLRLVSGDSDPPPTMHAIQLIRRVLRRRGRSLTVFCWQKGNKLAQRIG